MSTQNLITNNAALIAEYSSTQTRSIAIDSYGVDQEVILNPMTTVEQGAVARPLYISYIMVNGTRYVANQEMPRFGENEFDPVEIFLNEKITKAEVLHGYVTMNTGTRTEYEINDRQDGNIQLDVIESSPAGVPVRVELQLKSGTVLFIDFREQQTGGGELGE